MAMKTFSLLIKPASFDCNLRCQYCFYLKKNEIYGGKSHHMNPQVLECMVRSYMALDMPMYSFCWQGGEPTVMGLDFYKEAIRLMQKYGRGGKQVSNALQTNGTLIDDEWAKFFRDYSFLLGISVDGPAELHDKFRKTCTGEGSHALVMRGMDALKRNKAEFNVLTLVSQSNVKHPLEVYRYLRDDLGIKFMQYIECIEFGKDGKLLPFCISGPEWGEFLCQVFDEWYKYDRYEVSVRHFDSVLFKMLEGNANVCAMGRDCREYLVVENNGDIYPCDFFVEPRFKLGNIMSGNWRDFLNSPIYEEFGARKRNSDELCMACPWFDLCAGCCPKNRADRGEDARCLSVLCAGWKMFYEHTIERFRELTDEVRKRRAQEAMQNQHAQIMRMYQSGQISRNSSCPCGSGRKFKQCCGKKIK
jgi:uncharacterized protein